MVHPDYAHIGDIETRVIEECSEVIKALCKVQRFGWFVHHPTSDLRNVDKLQDEIEDLERVLAELKQKMLEF
jgi:hypothetical protein